MSKKKQIPANAGHFLRTKTDSTDFKNENLTRKNKTETRQRNHVFLKKYSKRS